MFESIAAAVDARSLAIPDATDAIVFGLGQQVGGLAAHDGGGGQLFVDGRDEADVMLAQQIGDALQRGIQRAHWRSAISGDQPGRVQAPCQVGAALVERQARQGLYAAHDDRALLGSVAVVQAEFARRCRSNVGIHGASIARVAGILACNPLGPRAIASI